MKRPIETVRSRPWPDVTAKIYRDRDKRAGCDVYRTVVASDEYPELKKERVFETIEQARAHAKVVLGN